MRKPDFNLVRIGDKFTNRYIPLIVVCKNYNRSSDGSMWLKAIDDNQAIIGDIYITETSYKDYDYLGNTVQVKKESMMENNLADIGMIEA